MIDVGIFWVPMRDESATMFFSARAMAWSFVLTGCLFNAAWAGDIPVDLQLVLAVDMSSSMSLAERQVQRDGYIAALREPAVVDAIRAGPNGRIAVTYVEWADYQIQAVPWTLVDGPETAEEIAERLSYLPFHREVTTSISGALAYSAGLFANSGFTSDRKAIDISGDGPNNAGLPVVPIRDAVVAAGVTINGLPIMLKANGTSEAIDLDAYFRDCVIGGPDAFSMPVSELDQLAKTIELKLLAEILVSAKSAPRLLQISDIQSDRATDCMAGEKARGTAR